MAKLRIAAWHNLPSGGGKRALWHQLAGLVKRGHHVEVWCPPTADRDYLPLAEICPEHILPLAKKPAKSPVKFAGWMTDYLDAKFEIEAMRAHGRACAAEIKQGGFDVFFSNTCTNFAAPPVGRYVDIPKVLFLQEPRRRFYEALPEQIWAAPAPKSNAAVTSLMALTINSLKTQPDRLRVREEIENARQFGRILVNSAFTRESVARSYGLDAEVCYLGIDTEQFRPSQEPVENYLIGLGSVHFHKGADRAIRALAALPVAGRPKLIWVGNSAGGRDVVTFKELAAALGVELEIKVMVSDAELVSLLSRAKAMLYTSRLEPFGLAPLEANACGTPVVAIAEGGVRETIVPGENGLLAANARPETIAAVLRELLENPAHQAELRQRSRAAVVARWGMEAALTRLENTLRNAVMNQSGK